MCQFALSRFICGHTKVVIDERCLFVKNDRGLEWCALNPYPGQEGTTENIHMMRPCDSCRELRPLPPASSSPSAPATLEFTVRGLRHQALQVGYEISVLQGDYQDVGVRYARVFWPTRFDQRLPFEVRHQPLALFTAPNPQAESSFFSEWRMAQWMANMALERLRDMPNETPSNNIPSMFLGYARTALTKARNMLEELDRKVTQHEELERLDRRTLGRWTMETVEQNTLRVNSIYEWVRTLPETPTALESGMTMDSVVTRLLSYPDGPDPDYLEAEDDG